MWQSDAEWQADVESALSGIQNADVSFFYPVSFPEKRVAISYRQADQREIATADDAPYIMVTEIFVDTWGKNPAMVATTAKAVKERLSTIGFVRVFSTDLYEEKAERHHRAERYEREE